MDTFYMCVLGDISSVRQLDDPRLLMDLVRATSAPFTRVRSTATNP
jgi:hypothetical protein